MRFTNFQQAAEAAQRARTFQGLTPPSNFWEDDIAHTGPSSTALGPTLSPSNKNATPFKRKSDDLEDRNSYPWKLNSCWLDTSLELLYQAVIRNFTQFSLTCGQLRRDSGLYSLFEALHARRSLDSHGSARSFALGEQRDMLRKVLREKNVIRHSGGFESLSVWLAELVRLEEIYHSYRPASYFEVLVVDIHHCSGESIDGRHVEITSHPRRVRINQLSQCDHEAHKGDFASYFFNFISPDKDPVSREQCWRVRDSILGCSGDREDDQNLVVSLPVLFIMEAGVSDDHLTPLKWNFPGSLPFSETFAVDGCIYDLVGLALCDPSGPHFIARYSTSDRRHIFTYDDMNLSGVPIYEIGATFSSHVAGKDINLPFGFSVYSAFYHLRGGIEAQDLFFEARSKYYHERRNLHFSERDLHKLSRITYSCPDFEVLDRENCSWVKSVKGSRIEYIFRSLGSRDKGPTIDKDPIQCHPPGLAMADVPNLCSSIRCRCGVSGDAHVLLRIEDGPTFLCKECQRVSHVACQRREEVTYGDSKFFVCDFCRPSITMTASVGQGVLANANNYWYPARLIQQLPDGSWRVRWWRSCSFDSSAVEPGSDCILKTSSIVNPVLHDVAQLRKIQLGKWIFARDSPSMEDIQADPSLISYSKDIHMVLYPFKAILSQLLYKPTATDSNQTPAKKWLESNHKSLTKTILPFIGGLSSIERTQIGNWFDIYVGKNRKNRLRWMRKLPIAHAYTLVISSRIQSDPSLVAGLGEKCILQQAWEIQIGGIHSSSIREVDVDKECIEYLEDGIFNHKSRWSRATGCHQDGWDPYAIWDGLATEREEDKLTGHP